MDQFRIITSSLLFIFTLTIHSISAANDTIDASQSIRDGETLVSSGDIFELGFFNPGNSTNRYVGIWFKKIPVPTVVWVANRESPLINKSGVLIITASGNLALLNDTNGIIIWSSNATRPMINPTARLLDAGNLVVKDGNDDRPENFAWQSFDYPSNTLIAGIRLGWNYATGVETYVSSWRSEDDPAPGQYSMHIVPTGYPQLLFKAGDTVRNRLGPWNGLWWSGAPDTSNDPTYRVMLWMNKNELRYMEVYDQSVISMSRTSPNGDGQHYIWNSRTNRWNAVMYRYIWNV